MTRDADRQAVAVVGLACRVPGASGPDAFWRNLAAGVESIRRLDEEDLARAGVDPALARSPAYVRAAATIEGIDLFDADLFGISAREAELLDPQRRVFLECAWEAFEHAGYDPRRVRGLVGVWASAGASGYLFHNLRDTLEAGAPADIYQRLIATGADFLATQTAFKLDLRGPSVGVQTACSSSLVAVHAAAQSLLAGECDLALAGGVSLQIPAGAGYLWQEGMILSPDGHCRAFDARARGTVVGSGAAAVVLARLEDAREAGATVHAVLLGSAVNNDGARKAGFAAPSLEGQVDVITEALAMAGAVPDSIGYVEAHGTGTVLGDAVEAEALRRVFGTPSRPAASLGIGSVKSGLGHLDAAAGVAGLVKTVLALSHGVLPPSIGCEEPAVGPGPLRVVTRAEPWPAAEPRRAGVSSFGIGGTNAHVVLEAAPAVEASGPSSRPPLLVLSARTPEALGQLAARLADHLEERPELDLADVAFTLAVGRRALGWRRFVLADRAADVPGRLRAAAGTEAAPRRRIVFLASAGAPVDCQCALSARLVACGVRPDAVAGPRPEAMAVAGQLARPVPVQDGLDEDGRSTGVDLAGADPRALPTLLGELWCAGAAIDWKAYWAGERRRRLPLPTYPFERRRYWRDPPARSSSPISARPTRRPDVADWFYVPSFERQPLAPEGGGKERTAARALVCLDEAGLGRAVAARLRGRGWEVTAVAVDASPAERARAASEAAAAAVAAVVHLPGVTSAPSAAGALDRGLFDLIDLARAIGAPGGGRRRLVVVSNHVQDVLGGEPVVPEKAAVLGAVKVIPLEYRISCRHVDVVLGDGLGWLAEQVVREVEDEGDDVPSVALRGRTRWIETQAPVRLARTGEDASPPIDGGTYVITGGLGGVGLVLAEHLARRERARLVLLGRTLPTDERVREGIRRCQERGAEVLVRAADVADRDALGRALAEARARFGRIHGVLHCAGVADGGGVIAGRDRASIEAVLRAKVDGTRLLLELLADDPPDLLVLSSSLGGAIPGSKFGQVAYAAANEFVDALATARAGSPRPRTVSIAWSDWSEVGMSVRARRRRLQDGRLPADLARWFAEKVEPLTENLSSAEGIAAFDHALASGLPRLLVSPEDLGELRSAFRRLVAERIPSAGPAAAARPRPDALGEVVPAASAIEARLVEQWQRFFGVAPLGVEDDFSALGGDSLLAVELAERLRAALGRAVDPHLLVEAATVRALAARLEAPGAPAPSAARSVLLSLREGEQRPPLVLVHPIGGHPLFYRDLLAALPPEIPVLAFQAQGLLGEEPDATVEAMAERYLGALERDGRPGPYALAGASFGGLVAFEMARRLKERGREVALLAMIDTPGPGRWPDGDLPDEAEARRRIARAADDLGADEAGQSWPLLLSVWRANWRAMTRYRPQPFDGPLVFFRPREREAGNRLDYHEAWPALVRRIEVKETGGDHTTMNRRPHVTAIAARLARALASPAPAAVLRAGGPGRP